MFWISAAKDYMFGWAGVDMLIGFACIAVAVFVSSLPSPIRALLPDIRKWAIAGAVVAFTCMGCIAYGHKKGIDFTRAQWDAALAREAAAGEKARADAKRDVPDTTDRWVFNDDPFNRNRRKHDAKHKGPVRWLEVNPFRRVE